MEKASFDGFLMYDFEWLIWSALSLCGEPFISGCFFMHIDGAFSEKVLTVRGCKIKRNSRLIRRKISGFRENLKYMADNSKF
jgi:hypothetical protein